MVGHSVCRQPGLFPDPQPPRPPLVVAYGLGVDSTALLIGLKERGIRPDLILFADTGGEKPATYAYLPLMQSWLRDVDFPPVITVRYRPRWASYRTLYENCWQNETLPSLAFGRKSCSLKWKRQPQDQYVRSWAPARAAWNAGCKVRKLIGFEAGEEYRRYGDQGNDPAYDYGYPLMDWEWTREICQRVISGAGLPVPPKSACYFCPASKKPELVQLSVDHPQLFQQAVSLEDRYRAGKHWRGAAASTVGLGRRFSWRQFAAEVALPRSPTPSITQGDSLYAETECRPQPKSRRGQLW